MIPGIGTGAGRETATMTETDHRTDDGTVAAGAIGTSEGERTPATAREPIAKVRLTLTLVALAMKVAHDEHP